MKTILATGSIFILIIKSSFTFDKSKDYPSQWYTICQIDTLKEYTPTGEFTDSIQDENGIMVEGPRLYNFKETGYIYQIKAKEEETNRNVLIFSYKAFSDTAAQPCNNIIAGDRYQLSLISGADNKSDYLSFGYHGLVLLLPLNNNDSITDICLTKDLDGLSLTNKEV